MVTTFQTWNISQARSASIYEKPHSEQIHLSHASIRDMRRPYIYVTKGIGCLVISIILLVL